MHNFDLRMQNAKYTISKLAPTSLIVVFFEQVILRCRIFSFFTQIFTGYRAKVLIPTVTKSHNNYDTINIIQAHDNLQARQTSANFFHDLKTCNFSVYSDLFTQ